MEQFEKSFLMLNKKIKGKMKILVFFQANFKIFAKTPINPRWHKYSKVA